MRAPTDRKLERHIGATLRVGVSTAAAVVLVGAIVFVARHGSEIADDRKFRGEPSQLRGIVAIAHDAASFSARGIIQLGLVLLVATPVARVALSMVAFAIQGDRKLAVISAIVLAILAYGLLGSPS